MLTLPKANITVFDINKPYYKVKVEYLDSATRYAYPKKENIQEYLRRF